MSPKVDKNDITRGSWKPDAPYQALPGLPPSAELETKPVLKQCITARAALAQLKQATELIPNPAVPNHPPPVVGGATHPEKKKIFTPRRSTLSIQTGRRECGPCHEGSSPPQSRIIRRLSGSEEVSPQHPNCGSSIYQNHRG